MSSEVEIVEGRLTSLLGLLQAECGILDRMVYKNKNQHRRCSYFQYLLRMVEPMLRAATYPSGDISSLSQKKQSIKITQDGIEDFREFFPISEDFITLECVWKSDKFVLHERKNKTENPSQGEDFGGNVFVEASTVNHTSIGSVLG